MIGRSKDLIINAGKNVYPQDLEAIVNELPGIHAGRTVVVFGVPDEREGTELIAVVAEVAMVGNGRREGTQESHSASEVAQRRRMVTVSICHPGRTSRWLLKDVQWEDCAEGPIGRSGWQNLVVSKRLTVTSKQSTVGSY